MFESKKEQKSVTFYLNGPKLQVNPVSYYFSSIVYPLKKWVNRSNKLMLVSILTIFHFLNKIIKLEEDVTNRQSKAVVLNV